MDNLLVEPEKLLLVGLFCKLFSIEPRGDLVGVFDGVRWIDKLGVGKFVGGVRSTEVDGVTRNDSDVECSVYERVGTAFIGSERWTDVDGVGVEISDEACPLIITRFCVDE